MEIKYTIYVTNNSEKDYNNVAYYRYGTKKDNPVKLSINTIVDYIDQKIEQHIQMLQNQVVVGMYQQTNK